MNTVTTKDDFYISAIDSPFNISLGTIQKTK